MQAHRQAQLRNLTATKLETAKRSSQHSGGAIRPYSNRVHPTLRRPRLADVGLGGTPFNWNFLRLPSGQSIHFLEDFSAVFLAWARPRLPLPSLPFPLQAAMPDDIRRQSAGPQEPFSCPSAQQSPRASAHCAGIEGRQQHRLGGGEKSSDRCPPKAVCLRRRKLFSLSLAHRTSASPSSIDCRIFTGLISRMAEIRAGGRPRTKQFLSRRSRSAS